MFSHGQFWRIQVFDGRQSVGALTRIFACCNDFIYILTSQILITKLACPKTSGLFVLDNTTPGNYGIDKTSYL